MKKLSVQYFFNCNGVLLLNLIRFFTLEAKNNNHDRYFFSGLTLDFFSGIVFFREPLMFTNVPTF